MAEKSLPQHPKTETYTGTEKALISTLNNQLRNALDQRDRLAAEVERLKKERWADPTDIDPDVIAAARRYLAEHRTDDEGPVLLIRDLYDIAVQKLGAAGAERATALGGGEAAASRHRMTEHGFPVALAEVAGLTPTHGDWTALSPLLRAVWRWVQVVIGEETQELRAERGRLAEELRMENLALATLREEVGRLKEEDASLKAWHDAVDEQVKREVAEACARMRRELEERLARSWEPLGDGKFVDYAEALTALHEIVPGKG